MQLTITSVISILFFSSIALGLIHFIIKRNQSIMKIGIRFLSISLLLIGLRLFFPIELPFTQNIFISTILPDFCLLLLKPVPFLKNITIQSLLAYIWLTGAVIAIINAIRSYNRLRMRIHNLDYTVDQNLDDILADIIKNHKKKTHFHLIKTDKVSTPMIFGILRPYILIPDMELTDKEWRYILSHEAAHYYHGDLFLKFACEMLRAIYWWNPIITILKKQMSNLMEINIDAIVTKKMDELQIIEYLECLLKIAKLREKRCSDKQWITAFNNENTLTASTRIHFILNGKKSDGKFYFNGFIMMLLLTLIIIYLPNFFIIEPYGVSDEARNETYTINKENAYFIMNTDDTYSFYLNHEYQATVENIFDENIPVYQNIQDVPINDKAKPLPTFY